MKFLIPIILGLMLASSVSALSVVSDFLENNTIILKEHESRLYGIRLQNGKDYAEFIRITYDDQYVKIIDYWEQYEVPPKSAVSINFNVSSDNLPKGQTISVGYTVHELSGSGEGVPLLLKISKNFKVKAEETPKNSSFNSEIAVVMAIIALSSVCWIYFKNKKHNKPKKKKKTFKKAFL